MKAAMPGTGWELARWTTLAALAAFSLPAHAQIGPAESETVEYVFERGDTLFDLADKYMRKRSHYRIVQRLNRIGDPHRISIGKRIKIPFRLLKYRPSLANLDSFRGDVSIQAKGRKLAAAKGLDIAEGSRISTAAGSFLTLGLEDGSKISMPSNSQVRITRLRQILMTGSVDYEIAVESGRIRSKVSPFDKEADRYRVRTPVAVSAVRGTDYRTRVDAKNGTAFSETVEGEVEVAAAGENIGAVSVAVPAGTGAAATVTGELVKADLLTPPELVDPALVQSEEQLQFAIVPSERSVGYRLVVSSDAGFVDVIDAGQSEGAVVSLPGLPDGRYYAKATALGADGFEGLPAAYAFKRQLSTLSGSAGAGDFGYRFKWQGEGSGVRLYRFQLVKDSKSAVPLVDEEGLIEDVITLSDLPDGEYYWRVGVTQISDGEALQKWTDFEKLTVAS